MRITARRRAAVAVATLLVAVGSAGCSSGSDAAVPTSTPTPTPTVPVVETVLPSTLVGAWGLQGAGIPSGSVLRISSGESADGLILSRPGACFLFGGWRATTGGLFIGQTTGGSGECPEFAEGAKSSSPVFLQQARGFGRVGGQLVLTAADRSVVVTLLPGATPIPNPNAVPEYSSIPQLTAAARVELDAPTKVLPSTTAASPAQIEGAWRPVPQNNPKSVLRFDGGTGRWGSSDGCNGNGGPWALAASGGSFLAVGGPETLVGCDNDNTSVIQSAVYAGFDGAELVFGDKDGKVIGRFVRAPATSTP